MSQLARRHGGRSHSLVPGLAARRASALFPDPGIVYPLVRLVEALSAPRTRTVRSVCQQNDDEIKHFDTLTLHHTLLNTYVYVCLLSTFVLRDLVLSCDALKA